MIRVKGISKRYAAYTAVDNISFQVEKGQIVGFLGPNGAGKTTTMRILTCFQPPSSGTAEVAGFDVMEKPLEVKRRIGYLPETPPLYPEMEVSEYLHFAGRLKGVHGAELKRRVGEVMEKCNVTDVAYKLVSKLSKGYKQRVGLAQAILHNPDVLILDEPTSGLDPKQIMETRELIKSLAGEHTIVLSTHILPEVEQVCEQVVIISRGKVVATDSVEQLTQRRRGNEAVAVHVAMREGLKVAEVQTKLETLAGVSRVLAQPERDGQLIFEVESVAGHRIRSEVARTIVGAGLDLLELRPVSVSLEEVFLQLTESAGTDPRLGGQPETKSTEANSEEPAKDEESAA